MPKFAAFGALFASPPPMPEDQSCGLRSDPEDEEVASIFGMQRGNFTGESGIEYPGASESDVAAAADTKVGTGNER